MLVIVDNTQHVIAEFRATVGTIFSRKVITSGDASRIMAVLRHIPRDLLQVEVKYPKLGSMFLPFTTYGNGTSMNLDFYAPRSLDIPETNDGPRDAYYFVPLPAETPNDGFLSYATIESIKDVFTLPARTVIMLRADQENILQAISDYAALFKVDPKVLTGLPGAVYSATFEEASWAFDKVAYVPFINELSSASDISAQLAAEKQTPYDVEKSNYTRANGTVKQHQNFLKPEEDDDIADETSGFSL